MTDDKTPNWWVAEWEGMKPAEVLELELATEADAEIHEEWRVAHMDGPRFDRTSSWFPLRSLAASIREVRGGTVQRRVVAQTPWADDDDPPD